MKTFYKILYRSYSYMNKYIILYYIIVVIEYNINKYIIKNSHVNGCSLKI